MLRAISSLANGGTFNNPTFTGTRIGVEATLAQSGAAITAPADITLDTLATVTVPANTLGATGGLKIRVYFTFTNNTNNKNLGIKFGSFQIVGGNLTTQLGLYAEIILLNRGATNSQVAYQVQFNDATGFNGALSNTGSVDTTASQNILFQSQKAVAGDTVKLEFYSVTYLR